MYLRFSLASIVFVLTCGQIAHGSITTYTNKSAWTDAVGQHTHVDFGGIPHNTFITDHYFDLGIQFTNSVFVQANEEFSGGGRLLGLNGIRFEFTTPQHAVGVNYWGAVSFALYLEGDLVGLAPPGTEFPFGWFTNPFLFPIFAGVVSEQPFDEVYLFRPSPPHSDNVVGIDDLFWGMPIPAPGAIPLLALAFMSGTRRRK